jgi:hypothetical protein
MAQADEMVRRLLDDLEDRFDLGQRQLHRLYARYAQAVLKHVALIRLTVTEEALTVGQVQARFPTGARLVCRPPPNAPGRPGRASGRVESL